MAAKSKEMMVLKSSTSCCEVCVCSCFVSVFVLNFIRSGIPFGPDIVVAGRSKPNLVVSKYFLTKPYDYVSGNIAGILKDLSANF